VMSRERAYAVEIAAKRIASGDIELFGV
jgi:hypothetical protein